MDNMSMVRLYRNDTELKIVEKLQRLRAETSGRTEINFNVDEINWTERIAWEMIGTLQQYATSKKRWGEGFFRDNFESEPFFQVIEAVAKRKLFRVLIFSAEEEQLDLSVRFAFALASIVRQGGRNGRLERVDIQRFEISANALAVLATALATVGETKGLNALRFLCCDFIKREESGGLMGGPQYLAAGLASNTTLKTLERTCNMNDSSLASIVGALSSHPSLEVIKLEGCEYGRSTIYSIHRWLRSDSCRLRELQMDGGYMRSRDDQSDSSGESEPTLNAQLFLQDLPRNTSLEALTISHHYNMDEKDVSLLLGSLYKLPNLRCINLKAIGDELSDYVALLANLAKTMPAHRLRCLNLDHTGWLHGLKGAIHDKDLVEKSILQLLEVFPELGYLGKDLEEAITDGIVPSSVVLQLDRNRCFGPLQHGATIPLSVWPLVMAKANKNIYHDCHEITIEISRKATILYEMLQGPVLVGRGSL